MSQVFKNRESGINEMIHDVSTLFGEETYSIAVESPEEVRKAQAYVRENPGTTVFLDFQIDAAISRGANERSNYFEQPIEYSRLLGGMTEHIDRGSYGVVTSEGCYQDFKTELAQEVEEVLEDEISVQNKDIFLEGEQIDREPKIIGTAARMGDAEYGKMYGAIWREQSPSEPLRRVIEQDVVGITPEDYDAATYPIEEAVGETLWEQITENAENATATLFEHGGIDPTKHDLEGGTEPMSCPVHVGADTTDKNTPGWEIGEIVGRKQQTR